jgi:hypothetical protein
MERSLATMALEDDEDGIDSMEIGASDDEEEIEIPPFLSYVTTWRFWCKFAMWPVAFLVVNVISFSTLLVFDQTEYSFNAPEPDRRTAQRMGHVPNKLCHECDHPVNRLGNPLESCNLYGERDGGSRRG